MRIPLPLAAVMVPIFVLSACVPAPRVPTPPPAPPPATVPTPTPTPRAADWRDWPLTAGTWRYRSDGVTSLATYGNATATLLSLRCDPAARRVTLTLASALAAPVTVRTSTTLRTLPAAVTQLAATDPLLEAIGFSRGRFVIEQPGAPPLVVPAWAEIERVTEDCR